MSESCRNDAPRVLIVAEHASTRYGGEALLPLQIFRRLRARGVDARMIVHERTRAELRDLLPDDIERVHFVTEMWTHTLIWEIERRMPARLAYFSIGYFSRFASQWRARRIARRLIAEHGIALVHQPIPVSPREPSLMFDLGVPVVMGPMNGGMAFPPTFEATDRGLQVINALINFGRLLSNVLNDLIPGKLRAATLIVANDRTSCVLPRGCQGRVVTLVENGVDRAVWSPGDGPPKPSRADGIVRFVYLGRLVDWKAVDLLLLALKKASQERPLQMTIVGDGKARAALEAKARDLGLSGAVRFTGWLGQAACSLILREADSLVMPSLWEAGGAAVLEGMAMGLPIIATAWGGPADYIDESCGILVNPSDRETFVAGLAGAMLTIARSPEMRERMGRAAIAKVFSGEFDWERKIDRILEIYRETISRTRTALLRTADESSPG